VNTNVHLPRLAFTAMEAPAVLGVSHDYFRDYIAGELRWVRRGSKKLVARAELEAWLERNGERVFE
jgi:excisionase family DNA binding protein